MVHAQVGWPEHLEEWRQLTEEGQGGAGLVLGLARWV